MLRQQVHEALGSYDVLLTPTSGTVAYKLQDYPMVTSKETIYSLPFVRIVLTNTFNLSSSPAISVPCGFGGEELPTGLHLGGRWGRRTLGRI